MKKIFFLLGLGMCLSACSKDDFNIEKLPWLKEKVAVFSNNCTNYTRVYTGTLDGKKAYQLMGVCCELCNCAAPIYFEDGKIAEGLENNRWSVQNPNPKLIYECGKK